MRERLVIVGAGPVGLTLAALLGAANKDVLVLERDAKLHTDWRASTFHPPSLEMAEEIGILDDMLNQGITASKYQIRDWKRGIVAEFDFSELADQTRYPFRLQLEQYKYSAILARHIRERFPTVELRFGEKVTEVSHTDGRPQLSVETTTGEDKIDCDWLFAADGANSRIRQALNLPFNGLTYPMRQLLLSVDAPLLEWYPGICYVNYIADADDSPGMILKIPDVWRVSFTLSDDISDQEAVSDAYVDRRIKGVFGVREIPPPTERQVFRVHQRAIDSFRHGHIFLLGDAAHINSPHGGMGLNSGIHDAYDLARTLLAHIDGNASETELDAWSERRVKAARGDVQRISHRNTTEFGSKDEAKVSAALQRALDISADPSAAREWMLEASMLTSVRPWYPRARSKVRATTLENAK